MGKQQRKDHTKAQPPQSHAQLSLIATPASVIKTSADDELLELIRKINGQQKGCNAKASEPDNPEHPGLPPAA